MGKAACLLLVVFYVPVLLAGAQSIDDLSFYTDDYPPYNFIEDNEVKGISIDLLLEIFRVSGSRSGIEDIQLVPWARGYLYALERENILLFAMTRTPERENLFHWVGPIASSNMVLIAKKAKNIQIDSLEDIRAYSLGAVRDDIGEVLLRRLLGPEVTINLTNRGINTALQLSVDRIDLWSYEENVAFWVLDEAGLNPGDYEIVYSIEEGSEWYAVSKSTNPLIAEQMQEALDRIDESTRNRIITAYINKHAE